MRELVNVAWHVKRFALLSLHIKTAEICHDFVWQLDKKKKKTPMMDHENLILFQ